MKITEKEIALAAGVSKATVSRVVTNKNNVNEQTRLAVEKAMENLGYQYKHRTFKNAGKGMTRMVMAVVGDVTNQFYGGLIKGITDVIDETGNMVVLCNSEYNTAKEIEYIKYADSCNFLGVIMITAMESRELVNLLKVIKCPVVLVNRYLKSIDLDVVCIDNYRGGYMATSYLIENGHKKIAHLAGQKNSTASEDRLRGYIDAMKDSNLSISRDAIHYGDLKRKSGYDFGKKFVKLSDGFSAVFAGNDIMAAGFIDAVYEEGMKIPEDVSVICFDNSPVAVEGKVKLTTVCMEPYPMGRAASDMLFRKIQQKESENKKLVFSPEMIIRDSVAKCNEA